MTALLGYFVKICMFLSLVYVCTIKAVNQSFVYKSLSFLYVNKFTYDSAGTKVFGYTYDFVSFLVVVLRRLLY